jgi:NADPH2:quinone reductase
MIDVARWVAEGRLQPHIHARVPLEHTGEAIRMLDGRKTTGKVVITI